MYRYHNFAEVGVRNPKLKHEETSYSVPVVLVYFFHLIEILISRHIIFLQPETSY